jgi:hypothetical protein
VTAADVLEELLGQLGEIEAHPPKHHRYGDDGYCVGCLRAAIRDLQVRARAQLERIRCGVIRPEARP